MNQHAEQFAERCWAALSAVLPGDGETNVTTKAEIVGVLAGSWEAFEAMREQQVRRPRRGSLPPTLDEVKAYALERGSPVDPVWFHEFYANGNPPWHDSRGKPVLSWKQKFIMHENAGTGRKAAPGQQLGRRPQQASLGALQIELERVNELIAAIVRPGGAAFARTASSVSPEEMKRYNELCGLRDGLRKRVGEFSV